MAKNKVINLIELRKSLGLTQTQFWRPIGVTQSGGSRYESGRNMPNPISMLVVAVHIKKIIKVEQLKTLDVKFN